MIFREIAISTRLGKPRDPLRERFWRRTIADQTRSDRVGEAAIDMMSASLSQPSRCCLASSTAPSMRMGPRSCGPSSSASNPCQATSRPSRNRPSCDPLHSGAHGRSAASGGLRLTAHCSPAAPPRAFFVTSGSHSAGRAAELGWSAAKGQNMASPSDPAGAGGAAVEQSPLRTTFVRSHSRFVLSWPDDGALRSSITGWYEWSPGSCASWVGRSCCWACWDSSGN